MKKLLVAFLATPILRTRSECFPGIYTYSAYEDCVESSEFAYDEKKTEVINKNILKLFWLLFGKR